MSSPSTANALFVSALLAGLAGVAPCQSDLPESTRVVGCLSEASGKLMLTEKDGSTYLLQGHTAELKAHIADELSVSGRILASGRESGDEEPFRVLSFTTVLRKNPAGVQPQLGDPANWSTFTDKSSGVVVRHPKTFLQEDGQPDWFSNFVDPAGILTLHAWSIPRDVYSGSNFVGGTFGVAVDPSIRSEGTCRQFGSTTPGYTLSKTLGGIKYAQTQIVGVGMGTAYILYHLHTFQNGFCYEFTVEPREADGTGMEDFFCTMQWLAKENEQKLLDSLLSQVSFVAPERKNAAKAISAQPPVVTSLEQSQDPQLPTLVSWLTEGADYVQLQFPCLNEQVFVGNLRGANMKCGGQPDRNFPPNGSETLVFTNLNRDSVRLVLTVEPFSDGVEYHGGSKTITIEIAPTRH